MTPADLLLKGQVWSCFNNRQQKGFSYAEVATVRSFWASTQYEDVLVNACGEGGGGGRAVCLFISLCNSKLFHYLLFNSKQNKTSKEKRKERKIKKETKARNDKLIMN